MRKYWIYLYASGEPAAVECSEHAPTARPLTGEGGFWVEFVEFVRFRSSPSDKHLLLWKIQEYLLHLEHTSSNALMLHELRQGLLTEIKEILGVRE